MNHRYVYLFVPLLLSGCYKSAYEGSPPTEATLGTGIFQESTSSKISDDYKAPIQRITNTDPKLYMFEQQALFKARLDHHAIKAEMDDKNELTLNIPGNISFSINSAAINWNMHAILDRISSILRTYVDTSITIIGHTDARGNPEINNMLSKQRAESIANYLIRTNVSPSRIIYFGVSDREQASGNDTTQQRSMNRRVQIILTPLLPVETMQTAPQSQPETPAIKTIDEGEAIISPYPMTDYDL